MTKTKKATININGSDVEIDEYRFKRDYLKWKSQCESVSSEVMASIGSPHMKGSSKRGQYPKNLYLQLKAHVVKYLRPTSKNPGNTGTSTVIDQIDKSITEVEVYTLKQLSFLEDLSTELDEILETEKINPRNTLFTSKRGAKRDEAIPEKDRKAKNIRAKYKMKGGEEVEIYGHYRDSYFEAKYGEPELKGWWSYEKDSANPPLAQAIYGSTGKGKSVGITKGLVQILEEALEEIPKKSPSIRLAVQRNSGSLSAIPSVRKTIFDLLKRSDLFAGGKPKLQQMATILQSMDFVVGTKSYGRRTVSPSIIVTYVGKLPKLAAPVDTFQVKKIGPTAMVSLIMAVIGKKTYKLRNGNYLDIKGKTVVPEQKEVKKSWSELIWRD